MALLKSIRAVTTFQSVLNLRLRNLSTTTTKLSAQILINQDSNGIKKITLNRPEKKNAFTLEMYDTVANTLNESNTDNSTKLVVITGTKDYFSSGNDINTFANLGLAQNSTSGLEINRERNPISNMIQSLIDMKKPLIAVVNGHCVGIGVTLLAHCDAVFASDKSTFVTPFTKLGITAECCSSYLFPRIMGWTKANDILMFGSKFSAQEMKECGIITETFSEDVLETESAKRIAAITSLPFEALLKSKELIKGPQRKLLHEAHKAESLAFDPKLASECTRKFMDEMKRKK